MGFRKQKLESQIKKLVGNLLVTELKDPRIGFVTVTRVELSKDYGYADIFVSVIGDAMVKSKTLKGLESAKGFMQYKVGKQLKIRTTPQIRFHLDTSIEEGVNMVHLLEKLEKESVPYNDENDDAI